MFETLLDLKNNKIRKEAQAASSTVEQLKETLKKYLAGLAKKSCESGFVFEQESPLTDVEIYYYDSHGLSAVAVDTQGL